MFKLGLIGYGSMGSTILKGFLSTGAVSPREVIVSTRTPGRLADLADRWPEVTIAGSNLEVARQSRLVIIGVRPRDVKPLLDEIVPVLSPETHLMSIASGVTLENLGSRFQGRITKVIPSMTSEACAGVSLICHNSHVSSEDAALIDQLFSSISTVKIIKEENFEAAADLTSCAPGLFSAMVQEFARAGGSHSTLSPDECEEMAIAALYGTAKLLYEKGMGPDEVIGRVATKGGITEEGVKVLRKALPATFDEVFRATLGKHEVVKSEIQKQFDEPGYH